MSGSIKRCHDSRGHCAAYNHLLCGTDCERPSHVEFGTDRLFSTFLAVVVVGSMLTRNGQRLSRDGEGKGKGLAWLSAAQALCRARDRPWLVMPSI